MSWLPTQNRMTQAYCAVLAALNDCGVKPDGAEIKPYWREELALITPPITNVEAQVVMAGFLQEGVKFHVDEGGAEKFEAHPWFLGMKLRPKK